MNNYSQYKLWQEQDGRLVPVLSENDLNTNYAECVDAMSKPLTVIGDINSIKGRKDLKIDVDFKIEYQLRRSFINQMEWNAVDPEIYENYQSEKRTVAVLIDNKPSLKETEISNGIYTYDVDYNKLSDNKQKELQPYKEIARRFTGLDGVEISEDVSNTDAADKKAKELVQKFSNRIDDNRYGISTASKDCALIAVDEILKVISDIDENVIKRKEEYRLINEFAFWQDVKQSISKL